MAYLAVNKKGIEVIFHHLPKREEGNWIDTYTYNEIRGLTSCAWGAWDYSISLPKGSIEKLIGKKLTWKDEPVKI
jgi:hypothetical protein